MCIRDRNKTDSARHVLRTFRGNHERFLEHCSVELWASQDTSPLLDYGCKGASAADPAGGAPRRPPGETSADP
eukprot:9495465-Pyramimonas_sp.AAC.1